MRELHAVLLGAALSVSAGFITGPAMAQAKVVEGEVLDPATYAPAIVESLDEMLARAEQEPAAGCKGQRGTQGTWVVPSARATYFPRSGEHYATNKSGNRRMGIGFPHLVDVHGAYFAGQASYGAWTTGVRVIGYRAGEKVQETKWFRDIGNQPKWFAMGLQSVDRIEIHAEPVYQGCGWYALDDLTFSRHSDDRVTAREITVVDFEDLDYRTKLTGTAYAGLTWEAGPGASQQRRAMPPPSSPPSDAGRGTPPPLPTPVLLDGTPPILADGPYDAIQVGVEDQWCYPPDTMGAVGLDHYIELVNCVFSIYEKYWPGGPYEEQMPLSVFFSAPEGSGDPRILFDPHSQRWFAVATSYWHPVGDPQKRIYLAVSSSSDPTGDWFKTSYVANQGIDSDFWADYPTLGVDENGIYIAAAMIGGGTMTIWAIDKDPLITEPQSLGYIKAWRGRPHDGAIQPAITYGSSGGEYLISRQNSTHFRLYHVNSSLTTLTVDSVTVAYQEGPPLAPAAGGLPIDTLEDARLMMAVYRDGSIWTCHTIGLDSRAACRWYEINASAGTVEQYGSVAHSSRHYYYPSLMVNSRKDVVMGVAGSGWSEFVGGYYTGRLGTDPPGHMAEPVLYRAGEGPYTYLDDYGRNRWGDYTFTCLDPEDDLAFYTIQEYAESDDQDPEVTDLWGTSIVKLIYEDGPTYDVGDMNCDGAVNFFDIEPFVLAITDPAGYEAQYPDCDLMLADCNDDGSVNFFDIDCFVILITG